MARPLSVAVVARGVMPLHGVGGLERSVRDLVRHLGAREVEVTLIVPPPAAAEAREQWISPLATSHIRLQYVPYLTFPFANRRGTTILDRSTAYLLYGYRAGRAAGALAARRGVDVIHGFGASVLGCTFGPPAPVPLVLNPQGLEEFGATAPSQPALKAAGYAPLRWAVRRCARAADCILATDHALEPTVARHLRPRPGQVRTIPNGIDLVEADQTAGPSEGTAMRQRHGIGSGETVFLSVGRLEYNKGFDVLAAALANAVAASRPLVATGWRWVLVGAGPYAAEIRRAVQERGIGSHVLFTGRVSDGDLHAWYEAASVFVHPSRYEGSSLVTLEAMAHRRALIATTAGGLRDKVEAGVNGWLVPPGDAAALGTAIGEAAALTPRLTEMGSRSRALVEREFSWPVLAQRTIALYEELLAGRRGEGGSGGGGATSGPRAA